MKLLLVEDDAELAAVVELTLRRAGFWVYRADSGDRALQVWADEAPEVIVTDANLPGIDGFELVRRIRQAADTPIIMITVRGAEDDMVRGLELGADDYITKPFGPRQLVARIKAVLRRQGTTPNEPVSAGPLTLDSARREVQVRGKSAQRLTPMEYRLLHALLVAHDQVISTDDLIDQVWGYRDSGDSATLRQLIRRLRQKIETDAAHPTVIETVAGLGYILNSQLEP
ncbi:MAG TPA: response regulator transcription factor, partial [Aggregatilineales bacterium]|nr:response regulator transcription factor [Aggregatilineales bacterium]